MREVTELTAMCCQKDSSTQQQLFVTTWTEISNEICIVSQAVALGSLQKG